MGLQEYKSYPRKYWRNFNTRIRKVNARLGKKNSILKSAIPARTDGVDFVFFVF